MIAKVFLDPCPICIKAGVPKKKRCKGHAGDALVVGERRVDVFLDLPEKVTPSEEGATVSTSEADE